MLPGSSLSSSTSFSNLNPVSSQDRSRTNTQFTPSQSNAHNFVGGNVSMGGHTGWNNSPAGMNASGLNDTLAQSRPQYQTGYLMSLAQGQSTTPNGQRYDDAPLIQPKAKMNPAFSRTSPSDFGTESMFESSKHRHRETFDDENGPPTNSVVDIVNEFYTDFNKPRKERTFSSPASRPVSSGLPSTPPSSHQILHVVIFGYPPSRYSSTVAYFKSLAEGGTTEVETSPDVENAFRIGFKQPMEAARACRRNGETISGEGGRWMIGTKWADPQLAEHVLGSAAHLYSSYSHVSAPESAGPSSDSMDTSPDPVNSQLQRLGSAHYDSTSTIGTPIKLAPSASAFRKVDPGPAAKARGSPAVMSSQPVVTASGTPTKGMFGQVSDLIFGW